MQRWELDDEDQTQAIIRLDSGRGCPVYWDPAE
jgi:hypothetical protein